MQKIKKIMALLMGISFLTIPCLSASAEEGERAQKDLTSIIEDVQMLEGQEDIFDKEASPFTSAALKVNLNYDMDNSALVIADQDRLSIKIVPEDEDKSFIRMNYATSLLKLLEDSGAKLADLNLRDRRGVELTFADISASFRAEINMPFEVNEAALESYFEKNPAEDTVIFQYKLQYNGVDTGRVLNFSLKKRGIGPVDTKFYKTRGLYKQEGELGQGEILYNIGIATNLGQSNEFLIYDTPDVNQSFDGDMSIYAPTRPGEAEHWLTSSNHYIEPGDMDEEDKMEIFVYDIYYLTADKGLLAPRQAEYEEKTVQLQRENTATGEDTLESMDVVSVPKNILVEKMSGEALTEEEQQLIEDNGGLYQTVGKGFKVRIKNFKGTGLSKGGYCTLVYYMSIKNNSPIMDERGFPKYLNMASYYGQEIPSCTPDDISCAPVTNEKTKLDQVNITSGSVTTGSVTGDVDPYSQVNFTKVAADEEGQPDLDVPLGGAVFNIYKIMDDGSRELAVNKDNLNMENLITNEAGKLCENTPEKKAVNLRLERGNYIFEEVSAPENYEIVQTETPVTVGLLANNVIIANKPGEEPEYEVNYRFESADKEKELPQAVIDLLPKKQGNVKNGTGVTAETLPKTEVESGDGVWSFGGWDKDSIVIDGANAEFIGVWTYKEITKVPETPSDKGDSSGNDIHKAGTPGDDGKKVTSTPKTGDGVNAGMFIMLLAVSGGTAFFCKKGMKGEKEWKSETGIRE